MTASTIPPLSVWRGSVHWECDYATDLNIEVDPQRRRFGRRRTVLLVVVYYSSAYCRAVRDLFLPVFISTVPITKV
jgi:hypothetical protein